MKKFAALRLPACVLAATVAMNGCANMDQKTQSAGVGAAVNAATRVPVDEDGALRPSTASQAATATSESEIARTIQRRDMRRR